jgi:hypothetical protein
VSSHHNKLERLILSLLIVFLSTTCSTPDKKVKQTDQKIEYSYIAYDWECCNMVELKEYPVNYSLTIKDSVYTLTYIHRDKQQNNDTVIYILKEAERFNAEYFSRNHKGGDLLPMVNSTSLLMYGDYPFKNGDYKVYKYSSGGFNMDACVTHFWVPEFGIILKRSTTWRGIQKLRTNNDSINRQIEVLVDMMYQDQNFYKGCEVEVSNEQFLLERERRVLEREKQLLQRQEKFLEAENMQNDSK